ncbi:MAG: hypothetical protein FMNOHCHN_01479 [Ignavibacteriaceae bacterium]|nr:hypothetical protein [Ignavibacteriaceae bacterium]
MKYIYSLILSATLLIFSGCETTQQPARGFEDEIFVFADSLEFAELQESLSQVFEKEIETPQPERLFTIRRADITQLNNLKTFKNVVFIAPLNSGSQVSRYIETVLDSSAREKMERGEGAFISRKNFWAKGQLMMIITAKDMATLEYELLRNSDKLLYGFQKASDERLKAGLMGSKFEDKKAGAALLEKFDWTIYVQKDYKIAITDTENKFAWIRRTPNTELEIWIFIHWIDNADPSLLNKDSIYAIRSRITEKYIRTSDDKDYVVVGDSAYTVTETNFNGRYALLTQGLWHMTDKFMGGPFLSYTFYDESSRRIYMLDGSVYAPKYYKRNLIQQADVVLQSFRLKSEMTEKEIKEKLSALEK